MNFLKKTFTMFIAICITTSLFLTGCSGCSGCRPNIDEESVPEEMEKTDHYLLKGGVSPYKIVIPGDADTDELVAGERLQSLFKEATNVLLPIVQDTTLSTIDGDGEYILIGDNNFAIENDMVPQKADVKSTGYTIKTKDKCVYIVGGSGVGTLFGVYNFLGHILNYDYFAPEIYSLDKGVKELSLYDYDVEVIPDCEYNTTDYKFLNSSMLKNFSMYAPETVNVRGRGGHGSLLYTLDDEIDTSIEIAIKNHPKWFSEQGNISEEDAAVNDSAVFASTQLCYTTRGDSVEYEKLYKRMAQNVITIMMSNREATRFNCSVSDNHLNCDCTTCIQENAKYGTPAGPVVKLLNKVIETVDAWMQSEEGSEYSRDWTLEFYAYNNYQNAPAKIVDGTYQPIDDEVYCNKRLIPVLAYIGADYTSPIESEGNKTYKAQYDGWKSTSNVVRNYVYAQNFKDYLIPYNTFGVLSNYYKYFDGDRVFMAGSSVNTFCTGFDSLKIYLYSKLGVDVNANVEELIKKYFKNVYLDASDIMYNLFNEYRINEQRLKEEYPTIFCATTSCYQTKFINSMYYEATLFEKWRNDIGEALETIEYLKFEDVERYNKVYKMIVGERIWVNYFYWKTNRNNILYETLEEISKDLTHDIEYCGMSYIKGGPDVTTATFISEVNAFLGEMKR